MKAFKKAALAAAVASLPMTGFALEAMQDEALSEVTGQDGITITMGAIGAFDIFVGDDDAFANSAGGNGGIYIDDFSTGTGSITIDIDADADTLQAGITIGAGTWDLGAISTTDAATSGPGNTIIDMGTLNMSNVNINVQLGDAEDQGHFAVLSGTVSSGINLDEFAINDINSGGGIIMDLIVRSAGSGDLNLSGNINVTDAGLVIAGLGAVDVTIGDLRLGEATDADIGDITILGLTPPTITIAGH